MKIAIHGAGAIGGYFGARLAEGGADVHLITRGAHLEALKESGLRVVSQLGDLHVRLPATAAAEEIGPCDVVLFCVKATDTETAAGELSPLLRPDTAVISLQNGVTNEDRLAGVIGAQHVVGGVAYIMATITEPGVIEHYGEVARIAFGETDGHSSDRLKALLVTCQKAELDAELSEDIRIPLWSKMAFICGLAGLTASVRLPIGDLRKSPSAFEMYRRITAEVVAVARARDVPIPPDSKDRFEKALRGLPGDWYSSLYFDLVGGKPLELEALHGTVITLGREHGVPTPMCEAIQAILEPWALRNARPHPG